MTQSPGSQFVSIGRTEVRLPEDNPDAQARELLAEGYLPDGVASRLPSSSLAWAVLAEGALTGSGRPVDPVAAYAYARTGYHRGLDALRRAGWKGQGAIPAEHVPNQGFLRALLALARAASAIGEADEADRCEQFIANSLTSVEEISALG